LPAPSSSVASVQWAERERRVETSRDRLIGLAARLFGALDVRSRCVVLTLHRVGGDSAVSADHVAQHFGYLRENYDLVLPSDILSRPRVPKRTAIVTVDDAHSCLYDVVFPIAKSMAVPLAVCIPTDFVLRGRWLWFDRLAWCLATGPAGRPLDTSLGSVVSGSPKSVNRLLAELKRLHPTRRDLVIEEIVQKIGVRAPDCPPTAWRPTTVEQLREMVATGLVEICSHSVTHPVVSTLNNEELRLELTVSKSELESTFGKEVTAFCYPNGEQGDFDERTGKAVLDAGYRMAFTSIEGVNYASRMKWLALRRVHAHARGAVFMKCASGLGDLQRLGAGVGVFRNGRAGSTAEAIE